MSNQPKTQPTVNPWHYVRSSWAAYRSTILLAALAATAAATIPACNSNPSDVSAAIAADVDAFFTDYDAVKGLPEFKQGLADLRKLDLAEMSQHLPKEVVLGRTKFSNVSDIIAKASASLNVPKSARSDTLESFLKAQNVLGDSVTRADVEGLFTLVGGILSANGSESGTRKVLNKFTAVQVARAYNAAVICDVTKALRSKSAGLFLAPTPAAPRPSGGLGSLVSSVITPVADSAASLWNQNTIMKATDAANASTNACTAQTIESTNQQKKESRCSTTPPSKDECSKKSVIEGPDDCRFKLWNCNCGNKDDASTCTLTLVPTPSSVVSATCTPTPLYKGAGT